VFDPVQSLVHTLLPSEVLKDAYGHREIEAIDNAVMVFVGPSPRDHLESCLVFIDSVRLFSVSGSVYRKEDLEVIHDTVLTVARAVSEVVNPEKEEVL